MAVEHVFKSVSDSTGTLDILQDIDFTLGAKDFRLPGLGAYLQTAANQGNTQALWLGIGTLVLIIVLLDQLVWRPLLAWAEQLCTRRW